MDRKREIDILKALAIAGVILIHVKSVSIDLYLKNSSPYLALTFLDQAMRFSVPLFVALSGYTLALSYKNKPQSIKDFYRRRIVRILPYYFLATAIIYFYLRFVPPFSQIKNPYPLWEILFLGRADYHLYFIPMILSLYFAFPFLFPLVKKWPKATLAMALAIQSAIFISTALVFNGLVKFPFAWGDQQQYLVALTWIFYFVLGIGLSNIDRFSAKNLNLAKTFGVLLAVSGLALTIFESFRILAAHQNLIEATRFTRFPVMLFATGVILVSVLFAKYLLRIPKFAVRFLAKAGLMSFSIYLLHTIAIRMIILNVDVYPISHFLIFAAASLAASFILAWIFEEILKIAKSFVQDLLPDKAH
ncbi:MAG: acyltransferase [Candidatus Curtissbacteria bacterium]|nr:acyltransferase [Candidatus Curtissbacteria bacterium]